LGFDEEKNAEDTNEGEQKGESEPRGFFVSAETSEEEFKSIVRANADNAVNPLSSGDLHVIYYAVHPPRFRNIVDS
jgi:pre-mRNA-processing factor 40